MTWALSGRLEGAWVGSGHRRARGRSDFLHGVYCWLLRDLIELCHNLFWPIAMPTPHPHFPAAEKAALLALKGVGPTVLLRLEQLGIHSLAQLAEEDASVLTQRVAQLLGSSCWRNSPQARAALLSCIAHARQSLAQA